MFFYYMYKCVACPEQTIYDHLPRQRKLTPSECNEAAELLKMRVNNKLLQQHLSQSIGKIITLKDISNIKHSIRGTDGNDLVKVSTYLKAIEGMAFVQQCVSRIPIIK